MNHRSYLALAIPLVISTITTPILGLVDMAVVGQLPDPAYIGGVAVGTIIFNTMYWLFGFLRVSTSAFAAQAFGANNVREGVLVLTRPVVVALIVGIMFVLLQQPIELLALSFINPSADVRSFASDYFSIRIWGAPFTLMNFVILGWLMGLSRIKVSLYLQIFLNLVNIVLDVVFVKVFHWGVSGVAVATLIAEISTFSLGILLVLRASPYKISFPSLKDIIDPVPLRKMLLMNRDLLIRTVCLLIVFNVFTAKSASFGTEVLAANAILIQVHYILAYVFDGFANASSIFVGQAVGSKNESLYKKAFSLSCQWAAISSILISGTYWLLKGYIFPLFTQIDSVLEVTKSYELWVMLFPLTAGLGLILYGVFTGAANAAPIRNSMIYSLIVFLLSLYVLVPSLLNHGLWFAFILFSLARSLCLAMYIPKLNQTIFSKRSA
ncbi:MATE family efflux transporter [Bacillus sp. V33-4]|uniref:MATE family efflux transporter n=1 Tax=Bacillus sp. V33-4 TaxID=2054169 RepID=UPI000C77CF28|nr:MATE family efflux transporter [Bacillus sp. V33-4]PLR85792.1 MATE family efflux transporter [Bacillus sp. V33-4]